MQKDVSLYGKLSGYHNYGFFHIINTFRYKGKPGQEKRAVELYKEKRLAFVWKVKIWPFRELHKSPRKKRQKNFCGGIQNMPPIFQF